MNCPKCGVTVAGNAAFCEYCGHSLQPQETETIQQTCSDPAQQPPVETQQPAAPVAKPENLVTGIVGAILGALIGGLCILLLSQLGYVAAVSGLVLAVCTLKGYELLGNKLSTKGIIICIVLMLVTPYIADRIDWAIMLVNELGSSEISFAEAFAAIPDLVELGYAEGYWVNLAMLYVFVVLGGAATVWNKFKKK